MDRIDAIFSNRDRSNSSSSGDNNKREDISSHSQTESVDNVDGPSGFRTEPRRVKYHPKSLRYDMSGNKLMYIFNHHTFQDSPYFTSTLEPRDGTEHDVARLLKVFGKIGFTIDDPCDDFTHDEIRRKLEDICNMDHKNTSCIAIVILTHGDGGGIVNAADMPYALSIVINRILHERKLAGKPKLFFVQACRGNSADVGHQMMVDGRSVFTIPRHSDYFLLKSSFEEHVSFRSATGTWMIQTLCDVVEEGQAQDILGISTILNNRVAQKTSHTDIGDYYHLKKQIPETCFTLTKFLYLNEDN